MSFHHVKLFEFDELTSTQTFAKQNYHSLDITQDSLGIILARVQTKGIGTHKRSWLSERGNFFATFVVPNAKSYQNYLHNIPQITSCAVLKTLQQFNIAAQFKWLNDIYVHGAKIAGVLAESIGDYLFIGVGVNVNYTPNGFISIKDILQQEVNIYEIIKELVPNVQNNLELLASQGFNKFLPQVNNHLLWQGKNIIVEKEGIAMHGLLEGVNELGYLILRTNEGLKFLQEGSVRLDADQFSN